jgi:hypothetical protein
MSRGAAMEETIREAKGLDGVLRLSERTIQIRRNPFASLLDDGLRLDKEIPIERISSVDLEMPERADVGRVHLVLTDPKGRTGPTHWPVKNSNTVVFGKADLAQFEEMKSLIDSRILRIRKSTLPDSRSSPHTTE